jgi:hypothetical protein
LVALRDGGGSDNQDVSVRLASLKSSWVRSGIQQCRARLPQILDLFAEDSWRNVHAGELEVRPTRCAHHSAGLREDQGSTRILVNTSRSLSGLAFTLGHVRQYRQGPSLLLIVAALGTIGCDRVTKHAASAALAGTPDRSFLSDTIRVGYVENTGGFLSLGGDLPPIARDAVFTVATGIALTARLALTLRRKYAGSVELGYAGCSTSAMLRTSSTRRSLAKSVLDFKCT